MTHRLSDVALALSHDAKRLVKDIAGGWTWVAKLNGAPFELMQLKIINSQVEMETGRGYVLTFTGHGRDVRDALKQLEGWDQQ